MNASPAPAAASSASSAAPTDPAVAAILSRHASRQDQLLPALHELWDACKPGASDRIGIIDRKKTDPPRASIHERRSRLAEISKRLAVDVIWLAEGIGASGGIQLHTPQEPVRCDDGRHARALHEHGDDPLQPRSRQREDLRHDLGDRHTGGVDVDGIGRQRER